MSAPVSPQPAAYHSVTPYLVVHDGAALAGRTVADLALPPGLLIVTLQRGSRVQVPTRDTTLRPGDRLAVAVAPEAAHHLPSFREGLESASRALHE